MPRLLTACILLWLASPAPLHARVQNIFGVSGLYALSSSFYSLNLGAGLSSGDRTTRSRGAGIGMFYDSRFSVYSGLRVNLVLYPAWATRDRLLDSLFHGSIFNELLLECDVLAKKYLRFNPARGSDLWLGYGPAFQYSVSRGKGVNLRNYALALVLALGAHYRVRDRWQVMPELYLGSNIFLQSDQLKQQVLNVANTTDFFKNGFTVSLCVGFGYHQNFYTRN